MPKIKITRLVYQKSIFTPNFSSFGLQMAEKIKNTFWGVITCFVCALGNGSKFV